MLLVRDFLEHSARRRPDDIALVCGDRRWSYRELDERGNRVARALRAHGFARGCRAVLWGPNGEELVTAIFGVSKASGTFVVAHDSTKPERIRHLLGHCGAQVLVTTRSHALALAPLLPPRSGLLVVTIDEAWDWHGGDNLHLHAIAEHGDASPPPRDAIDRDLACLIYTSGSTGESKGVMSAHHQVAFASASILEYLGMQASDVVLCALPLAFDYGLYQLLMTFRCGGRLVLERSFTFPAECLARVAAERVTGLPGVPTMFALLLRLDLASFDLSSLRFVTNTAAALPPAHVLALHERLPGVRLFSMYGLTETKRCLYLPPELVEQNPGSVGIAIPGTEVWIEDDHGRRVGDGEIGELVVRGGHVMSGYWNDPAATAERFRPGPLPGEFVCRTGDLFRRDAAGLHWFVGRRDDMLKSRGEKVAPKEVEAVLHEIPGVVEAAVVGVPDAVLGEAIVAALVCSDASLTEKVVLRHCRQRLEDFKVPARVAFVPSLPRGATGKVRRADVARSLTIGS